MQGTPFDSTSLDATVEDLQFRIEQYLIGKGYRLGTYLQDSEIEWKLASGGVRVSVKPEYSPVSGDHAVVVTPISVQSWTRRGQENWKAIGTGESYDSPEELLAILPKYTRQKQKGGW